MVDYYPLSGKTGAAAYNDAQLLQPPKVADGSAIHRAYQNLVGGLRDMFTEASISMSRAAGVLAIESINDEVDQHITSMGADNTTPQAMSGVDIAAVAQAVPTCWDVRDAATVSRSATVLT